MEIDKLEENLKELSVELTALKHITDRLDKKGNQQIYEWQQNVELMAGDNDEMQAQLYTLRRPYASNNHNVRVELDETVIKELNVKVIQNLEAVQALKERAFETFLLQITEDKLKRYSHDDLIMFTSKFSNKIGFGGFSKVYLGRLSDGVQVAVKVLTQNRDIPKDVLRDIFVIEVTTMIKASHPNLIKLYGFCFDDNMKALIYEYMENGSLDKVLFKKHIVVEWRRLYEIAIDTAKVLAYLHHDCDDQIIHHDVKPANILLDSNLSPKVTDFGVAKIMNRDVTHFTMTRTRGTSCYIAPEMTMQASRVTYTCDVYSFGMTLFDILGMRINSQIQPSFPNEVWRKFDKGKLDEIINGCDIWEEDEESARILSIVALWCIQFTPEARPSMKDVVNVLEKNLQVVVPPNPFLASDKLFSIRQSQDMTYSRISTSSHQRSSAAQDTPAQFASQGESQIKGLPEEMTRKQPSFSEMLGSEMDDSDASGREPSAHWGSGNSPYLTPTHDDPNSLFSSYLLPVLEEPSSSFSEAGEDDPMPAIDSLQISGDAFPGQYLQACGYSINGTTSCNFEWVRHLEDGSVNYIDGAKQPTYLVTADDVDTYLAIEVQPLDNRKRKGELVKVFANEQRKITCDASSEGGPLLDPRRSTMWTKLDDSVKNKLILMHQMLRRGDIIWRNYSIDDEVDNVEFTALLVEDLYTNSYLSNELIDWYLFWYLKYSSDSVLMGRPSQIQSFFSLKAKAFTQYANMSDEDRIVEEYRIKRCLSIGLNASTEYLFVPMLNGPSHWTLLYLDLHDLKWHHYNSFKGTVTSRKAHKAAAEKFKKFLTSVVKPMIAKFRGVEVHKVTISPGLIVDEGAFQKNATDCGLYVCNFAKHVLMGNNQNWDDAEVYKMRREFIKGIINTPHHSWDPDNVYK